MRDLNVAAKSLYAGGKGDLGFCAMSLQVFRSQRVVTPDGVAPRTVHVQNGRIESVSAFDNVPPGVTPLDFGTDVLMPGLVDTHVHINEPGRTEWEGFDTATRAAAAGGVTTLLDMPLNSIPPTTTVSGLEAKMAAGEGKLHVDVGICGGAVPGNAGGLRALYEHGALAFKCFLADSGVTEFSHVNDVELDAAMRALSGLDVPLLIHAELSQALPPEEPGPSRAYETYLRSRPSSAEDAAVKLVLGTMRATAARAHVVHLSASSALGLVRQAKDEQLRLTVETCPHYLYFTSERIADGATEFKCAPPIRPEGNRAKLWAALREGLIDQVVTDHSPSSPEKKCSDSGDFMKAWGGIASLQLGLPVVWTEARARGGTLADVARWMCEAPARLIGMHARKGRIVAGADADLVVWDPDATWTVDPASIQHRHKLTPYRGRALLGVVKATYLRGQPVFQDGTCKPNRGQWLRRS